jgi:ribonucleotide reductase alpha subunit
LDTAFNSVAQEFIYTRSYSRWLEEEQRRERYIETVTRYLTFMRQHIGSSVKDIHIQYAKAYMMDFSVVPSMRALWAAGKVLEENNFTGYNCSFVAITEPFVFSEIMFILMSGTGVGFSVEREFIDQLPYIQNETGNTVSVVVQDSREGWAEALNTVLACSWRGDYVEVDYGLVRDRGERLKTMGGRASGPEPLKELFEFIVAIFKSKREKRHRRLTTLDCLDIANKIGEVVVAGGVRRSSEISLSDLDDASIAGAKSGEFWRTKSHRSMSNNSAVYLERPEAVVFLEEFGRLIRSRAGERGIFNREGARKQMMSSGRRKDFHIIGTNPCFTGDTKVWTDRGNIAFKDLVGKSVNVLTQTHEGKLVYRRMNRIQVTQRYASLVKVKFTNGTEVRVTPNHRFYLRTGEEVQAKNLKPDDSVSSVYRYKANQKGYQRLTNGTHMPLEHHVPFEDGIPEGYDVHHKDEVKYHNWKENLEVLDGKFHRQLHMVGDKNPIRRFPEKNPFNTLTLRNDVDTKEVHRLRKSGLTLQGIADKLNCSYGCVCKRLAKINHRVQSVEILNYKEDVYCGSVEEFHRFFVAVGNHDGVLVHNCGEILLRDQELCNLSEVIVRRDDTLEVLRHKVSIATMFGVWQSTFINFPYVRPKWSENCQEERLLGVSLTGIMDHPVLNNVNDKMKVWLGDLKSTAIYEAGKWAKRLGINMSAAITCVKPSGTVSQLTDCASGIHPRYSPFYIRRYRISVTDPLLKMMIDQGVKAYPEVGQDPQTASTMVLEFPMMAPKGAKTVKDYTALQQLEHWHVVKNFWCEHNPSITVYVGDDEWVGVAAWVYDHFDDITGVAFLPRNDHVYQLAPYEEITEEVFKDMKVAEPFIDFTQLTKYELEDTTDGLREYACVGDKCDV